MEHYVKKFIAKKKSFTNDAILVTDIYSSLRWREDFSLQIRLLFN